ncbi:MAG: DUF484 family protein [Paracoccaceae bacterium]|jgi:hypothetical protein|nr:DUF484 family protein [Paracoccaceae bacterium]MDP7187059.1 DUF484 family protein [Paracoccaceae bacterium]
MTSNAQLEHELREKILAEPNTILEDHDLMRALVSANEKVMGENIVDLRGIAMNRLESRLGKLETTHRSVIAAAYENLAGTNQIHRAALRLLDPLDFETFLADLSGDIADILRVDAVRLVLESKQPDDSRSIQQMGDVLFVADPGFIDQYITLGRNASPRQVSLRQIKAGARNLFGDKAGDIRSEACLKLDLGTGRLPGMLVMGAEDPHLFTPQQGTDLLGFYAGIFERVMRRWLS